MTIRIGDREVRAIVDGPATLSDQGDAAVIVVGEHKIMVESERILFDGKEQARIPSGAKRIDVQYAEGKLSAAADNLTIIRSRVLP